LGVLMGGGPVFGTSTGNGTSDLAKTEDSFCGG
jgi:hypothetical protein